MSKSLGNSPEPLELIKTYGADAVRFGMLLCSPAGNDLLYDENLIEQGRNFCNKIWNAMRLIKGWKVDKNLQQPDESFVSIDWFNAVFNSSMQNINMLYGSYRLSEALMAIYKLVWDDFCSWFLEMIKPAYQQPIDHKTHEMAIEFFEKLIKILHPFIPFITEEVWHHILKRKPGESIMLASMPSPVKYNEKLISKFDFVEQVIMAIRNIRKEKNIPQKVSIRLFVKKNYHETPDTTFDGVGCKLCNISEMGYITEKIGDSINFIVGSTEFYIPYASNIDVTAEINKLEEELAYTRGFLETVDKKLRNVNFVKNAPEKILVNEQKKKTDAESRIHVLEQQIETLKNN